MMNPPQGTEKKMKEGDGEEDMRKKIWSVTKLMLSLKNKNKPLMQVTMGGSSAFRWKKKVKTIHRSFFDNVAFKVVSVCEAVVLVSTVCFFYLCCGCHF